MEIEHSHTVSMSELTPNGSVKLTGCYAMDAVLVVIHLRQIVAEQVQEEQERSSALVAKHDSVLQQLSAEKAHTAELDAQIESQHKVKLCTTCTCLYSMCNSVRLPHFCILHSITHTRSPLCIL